MDTIGERLRFYRKQKGLSISEVSKQINVPATTYREWENGCLIRGEPYYKICKVFDISLIELLEGPSVKESIDSSFEKIIESLQRIKILKS